MYTRKGPHFPEGTQYSHPPENDTLYDGSLQLYYAWLLCRVVGSDGHQTVPALGGFISATGQPPVRKTTIHYSAPIHHPITDYATVQELLRQSEVATSEVAGEEPDGQRYVINTFDLGICMYITQTLIVMLNG